MKEPGWRDDDDIGMVESLIGSIFFLVLIFGSALIIM